MENASRYQLAGYTDEFNQYAVHVASTIWLDDMKTTF